MSRSNRKTIMSLARMIFMIIALFTPVYAQQDETPPPDFVSYDKEPVPVNAPHPKYPVEAFKNKLEGIVILRAWIGKDGSVKQAEVMKSDNDIFNEEAMKAARQWKWTPAMNKGMPIDCWVAVPFKFRVKDGTPYAPADWRISLKTTDEDLGDAVVLAREKRRHVLVLLGSTGEAKDLKLFTLLQHDPKIEALRKDSFIGLFIDKKGGQEMPVLERLGHAERFGLPVLIILNGKGSVIHTQDCNLLMEGSDYSAEKILGVLNYWTPDAVEASKNRE